LPTAKAGSLPISILINKWMPELQWEYGYPIALTIIASTTTFLYLRFRRMGWL